MSILRKKVLPPRAHTPVSTICLLVLMYEMPAAGQKMADPAAESS